MLSQHLNGVNVKQITCFALGALAGALGLYAYREAQAARELQALSDLMPEPRYTVDPQAELEHLHPLRAVPLDADIEALRAEIKRDKARAFHAFSGGVQPLPRGMTAPDLIDAVRLLLGDASLLGPNKSQEPS